MISQEMSKTVEDLLHQMATTPDSDRTATALFLSTYLMNHAVTSMFAGGDTKIAKAYSDLTRQVESLMQAHRMDRMSQKNPHHLTLVKK